MAEYLIQSETLDDIADAINAKTGGSSAMTPAEMVTAIGNIQTGGGAEVTIANDGSVTQVLNPDTIYHFTGDLTSLTITLNNGVNANYQFDFIARDTAPTLTIPSAIDTPRDFTVRKYYKHTVFFCNGKMQFILDAVLPSGYSAVPCVHIPLDGYVNTGKLLTKTTSEFNVTARIDSDLSGGTKAIFGALSGTNFGFLASYETQSGIVYQYLRNQTYIVANTKDNAKHRYYCGAAGIFLEIDSTEKDFFSVNPDVMVDTPNYPVFISARNEAGTPNAKTELTLWHYTHSVGGVWVIDLVPCKQESNQEYGFFDTVSGAFFGNSGSGVFTEGVE